MVRSLSYRTFQFRFLELTSEIDGIPPAYIYFSSHTKNVDIPDTREYFDINLDWMGKYSPDAIQAYAMKEFAKAKGIARWCTARDEERLAEKEEKALEQEEWAVKQADWAENKGYEYQ